MLHKSHSHFELLEVLDAYLSLVLLVVVEGGRVCGQPFLLVALLLFGLPLLHVDAREEHGALLDRNFAVKLAPGPAGAAVCERAAGQAQLLPDTARGLRHKRSQQQGREAQ